MSEVTTQEKWADEDAQKERIKRMMDPQEQPTDEDEDGTIER